MKGHEIMKVVITGSAGRQGPYAVKEFVAHGYDVLSTDIVKPLETLAPHVTADLSNLGEVYGLLQGADAVIHLAAIPVPYTYPNEVVFKNNVMATYNILEAAAGLGIKKVVIASSECSYGIASSRSGIEPIYLPLDEAHPQLPEDAYGTGKVVGEVLADSFHRRTGMQVVSLRLGNIINEEKYHEFPHFIHDSAKRKFLIWNYIDARDAATACRLAIEKDGLGSVKLNIAADDTSMDIPSIDLIKAEFPNVEIRGEIKGFQTLFNNKKAKEVLGWQPVHTWRNYVTF